jgi:Glyoxalase-like domain
MGYEIDHIFLLTDAGAPAADELVRLGLREGAPNRHQGQGTANRRFFFDNAMLEFVWVEDIDEARGLMAHPLRLADRWQERCIGACPFGICLRPSDGATPTTPFKSFEYRPAYLPAGLEIRVAQGLSLADPFWFFMNRVHDQQASPSAHGSVPLHRLGIRCVTDVTMTIHGKVSTLSEAAAAACGVKLRTGSKYHLRIAFDGGANRRTHQFSTGLPMEFCW